MKHESRISLFVLICLLITILFGCSKTMDTSVTITFDTRGGGEITPIEIEAGAAVILPQNPSKIRYTFEGWYLDEALTAPYEYCSPINSNITLYAKWSEGTEGLLYSLSEDASFYSVIGYQGTLEDVYISAYKNGLPITHIGGFKDNETITSVSLPDTTVAIEDNAFKMCSSLTSVNIPANVTTIGEYAFNGCILLSSITIESTNINICRYAFYHCYGLKSVFLPDGVLNIGEYAFGFCTGITNLIIPSGVINIGARAFQQCSALERLHINEGVTTIGGNAFESCLGLTSLSLKKSLITIEENAFLNCCKLIEIYNRSDLEIIAGDSGYGYIAYYAKDVYTTEEDSKLSMTDDGHVLYSDATEVTLVAYKGAKENFAIPNIVTSIGCYALYDISLTDIEIPSSVTSIGAQAFQGALLQTITFADPSNWYELTNRQDWYNKTNGVALSVTDSSANAERFTSNIYPRRYWYRSTS